MLKFFHHLGKSSSDLSQVIELSDWSSDKDCTILYYKLYTYNKNITSFILLKEFITSFNSFNTRLKSDTEFVDTEKRSKIKFQRFITVITILIT